MLAQLLEGFADLASSGLLLFGHAQSRKKADVTHPFGYGKELYFWTLISALIMLSITATFTFYFGFQRFLTPTPLHNTIWAYGVLLFTTCTNFYALSLSLKRLLGHKKITNIWSVFYHSSLIETKTALVLDLMGTSASFVGFFALILYAITGNTQFDGVGAMIIGIILALLAVILLLAVKDFLIGKSVSLQTIEIIKKATYRIEEVVAIQDIKAMHIGPETLLINIDIHAKNNLTTDELEKVIEQVKTEIRKDLPSAKHVQVELEEKQLSG